PVAQHGADEQHPRHRLRQQPQPVTPVHPGRDGTAHDTTSTSSAACSSRSSLIVFITVSMSTTPAYSPREPVTTASPSSSGSMASSASCNVDALDTVASTW